MLLTFTDDNFSFRHEKNAFLSLIALGQTRIVFVGKKAYMLMGVWPADRAEKRSSAFFEAFEMRVK